METSDYIQSINDRISVLLSRIEFLEKKNELREEKIKAFTSARLARKLKEEEDEENIPWYSDIAHLIKPNGRAYTRTGSIPGQMPNYIKDGWGKKEWFGITGDSMTCDDKSISIPNGSKVLARRLSNDPKLIPTNKSLSIIWIDDNGVRNCFCKRVSDVYLDECEIKCYSLNPDTIYQPFNIWFNHIIEIFEIEEIRG